MKKISIDEDEGGNSEGSPKKEETVENKDKNILSNELALSRRSISQLSQKEKSTLINLIDGRYPKGDTLFFLIAYNLNPLRDNQTYLESCSSYLRFVLLIVFLLLEVIRDKRGLFMVPLIVETFCVSFISLVRFFMENFKERKMLYLFMFLFNFLNLAFVVSPKSLTLVPPF